MLKLYKFTDTKKEYWSTWDNADGTHTIHWGELGTPGEKEVVKGSFLKKAEKIIRKEADRKIASGFSLREDEYTLLIEYAIEGIGTAADMEKRQRLEKRIDNTLEWTGLGNCDGGSINRGTMEVSNFVVDFETAKQVIEKDLKGTEFDNYTRIYDDNAGQ